MAASRQDILKALRAADAAGNADDARRLAQLYQSSAPQSVPASAQQGAEQAAPDSAAGVATPEPESNPFMDALKGVGQSFAAGMNRVTGGILQTGEDIADPALTVSRMLRGGPVGPMSVRQMGMQGAEHEIPGVTDLRRAVTEAADIQEQEAQALRPEGAVPGFAYDVASAAALMGPQTLATIATRNPSMGLGMMTGQVGFSEYNRSRAEGKSPSAAVLDAGIATAAEVGPEKLFGVFDNLALGKGVKAWAKTALLEAPSEMTTEMLTILDEVARQGEEFDFMKAAERVGYAGLLGAALGGIMGGPKAFQRPDKPEDAPPPAGPEAPSPTGEDPDVAEAKRILAENEATRVEAEPEAPVTPEQVIEQVMAVLTTPEQATEQPIQRDDAPVDMPIPVAPEAPAPIAAVPEAEPVETADREAILAEREAELRQQAELERAKAEAEREASASEIDRIPEQDPRTKSVGRDQLPKLLDGNNRIMRDENGDPVRGDPRLLREEYRVQLLGMLDQLIYNSGGDWVQKDRFRPDGSEKQDNEDIKRAGSDNPDWFKDNALAGIGLTTKETRNAVDAALAGRNLGVRQKQMIDVMLGVIQEGRTGFHETYGPQYASWQEMLRDHRAMRQEQREAEADARFRDIEGWESQYSKEADETYVQAYEEYINEFTESRQEGNNQESAGGREGGSVQAEPEAGLIPEPTAEERNRAEGERKDAERDGLGRDETPVSEGDGELFGGNTPGERPSQNTLFTEEAADAARQRMKARLGTARSGVDPEMLKDAAILAGYHVERGARTFAEFSKRMVEDIGEWIKPHLADLFAQARKDTGVDSAPDTGGQAEGAPTSAKRAVVDKERQDRGAREIPTPERESHDDLVEEAKREMEKDSTLAETIIRRVLNTNHTALTELEVAILLVHKQNIMQARDKAADAAGKGDMQAGGEWDIHENSLEQIDRVTRAAGTTWGRVGAFYQRLLDANLTLAAMERRKRAAKGGALTAEEAAAVKSSHAEIDRLRKELEKARAKPAPEQAASEQAYDEMAKRVEKAVKSKKRKQNLKDIAKKHRTEAMRMIKESMGIDVSKVSAAGLPPIPADNPFKNAMFYKGMVRLGQSFIEDGASSVAEFVKKIGVWMADNLPGGKALFGALTPDDLARLYNDSKEAAETDDVMSGRRTADDVANEIEASAKAGDPLTHRFVYKLAEAIIAGGTHGEKAVIDAMQGYLSKIYPDITPSVIRRIFSEYGKRIVPSQDDIAKELRELRTLSRLQSQIEDLEAGKAPEKTGFQRDEETQAVRDRQKLVNQLLKDRDRQQVGPPTPEQLAGIEQRKVNRLRNTIEDLEAQIARGKADEKGEPLPDSPEVTKLKKQAEFLRDRLRQIEEAQNPAMSPEQRQLAKLEAQREHLDNVLRNREASAKTREPFKPLTKEAADLKQEIDGLRKLVKQMRDEVDPKMRENRLIKNLEAAIDRYDERIKNGDFSPLYEKKDIPVSERVRALRKLRDARRDAYLAAKRANKPVMTREERINRQRQANLSRRIADLESRLQRGDFSKPPKPVVVEDDKVTAKLRFELDKKIQEYNESLLNDMYQKRGWIGKTLINMGKVLNWSRAVITSFDISAVMRQGGIVVVGHPKLGIKNFMPMLKAFRSEAEQHRIEQSIKNRPNYELYRRAGLFLSEWGGTDISRNEEVFMGNWAANTPIVAGSGRAYTTFLNLLRADAFDMMLDGLARGNQSSTEQMQAIANYVNIATGRGSIGKPESMKINSEAKQATLAGLSNIFFAPKWVASRFNFLAGQPFYRGDGETRKMIAKQYARFFLGASVMVSLAYAMAKGVREDEDDDIPVISFDPRDTDFLKIRLGNTRMDFLSGLVQPTVFMTRLITGTRIDSKGNVVPIRASWRFGVDESEQVPFAGMDAFDVMVNFTRSKLAPWPGAVVDMTTGENVVGEPVTLGSAVGHSVLPLALGEVNEIVQEQGFTKGVPLSAMVLLGIGGQTYGDGGWSENQGDIQRILDDINEKVLAHDNPAEQVAEWERQREAYPWLLGEATLRTYANTKQNRNYTNPETGEWVGYRVGQPILSSAGNIQIEGKPEWAKATRGKGPMKEARSAMNALERARPTWGELEGAADLSPTLAEGLKENAPDERPGALARRSIRAELDEAIQAMKDEETAHIRSVRPD